MYSPTVQKMRFLNHEKIHMAQIKNRAEKCRCDSKLSLLEKEKCFELRLLNNEKNKILSKYSSGNKPKVVPILNRSSSVMSMRSIKAKNCQTCNTCMEYQNIHDLLFTNDEIDIEKIICLYLLSTHDTRLLSPPAKRKYKMTKENSPLERLIYRSNKAKARNQHGFLLPMPLYILDFPRSNKGDVLINDGRLASKVLFNEKVATVLNTVFKALYTSNRQKMNRITQIAGNEESLLEILQSSKIQDYLKWIRTNSLITSCESFILKPVLKVKPVKLRFETKSKVLEKFLTDLHQTVLQLPARKKYDDILDEVYNENPIESLSPDEFKKVFDWGSVASFMSKHSWKMSKRSINKSTPRFSRQMSSASLLDFKKILARKLSTSNISKCSIDPKLEDLRTFLPSEGSLTDKSELVGEVVPDDESTRDVKPSEGEPIKCTLKQMRCEACMMKWMQPLPSPKTPLLTRFSASNTLQTNTTTRLSSKINRELYWIGSYDRRYSKDSGIPPRISKIEEKKKTSATNENVKISSMDLDRIKQEIWNQEAKVKLQEFLNK